MAAKPDPKSPLPPWLHRGLYPAFVLAAALVLLVGIEHLLEGLGYIWVGDRQVHQRANAELNIPETGTVSKGYSWFAEPTRYSRNSFGLRAPEPWAQRCPIAVLFLGDSYTYGAYVSDADAYPAILEERIKDPDVCFYNAGRHGYQIEDTRRLLARLLAAGLEPPRVVVHELLWNNLYTYDDPRLKDATDQYARFVQKKIWFPSIRYAFLRLHFHLAWQSPWVREHIPPVGFRPSNVDEALHRKMEAHLVTQWRAYAQEFLDHDMAFVSILIPYYRSLVLGDAPEFKSLIAAHEELGVAYLLLTRKVLPEDPFLKNDFHFGPQANRRIAELVEPLVRAAIEKARARAAPASPPTP